MRRWLIWLAAGCASFLSGALAMSVALEWIVFPFMRHAEAVEHRFGPLPSASGWPALVVLCIDVAGFIGLALLTEIRRSGRISASWLRERRRYWAVAAVTIAAIISPPDVVSQLALAIPAVVGYEVLIAAMAAMEG